MNFLDCAANIYSPFNIDGYNLLRNPAEANAGKYMNLSAFLEFAQSQGNVNVIINIEVQFFNLISNLKSYI
jgi:hypothetical protein